MLQLINCSLINIHPVLDYTLVTKMILGFSLVLTLLQVGVSFAMPLNPADMNELERSVDVLQNYFHEMHAINEREFASQQQHPMRRRPDIANAPEVHATNEREFSASQQQQPRRRPDIINAPEVHVHATNEREFASQPQLPRHGHPDTANAQLEYTPLPVYIQDTNSRLFLQYTPNSVYDVVIEDYSSTNIYQQWYVIQNDHFPEYYAIANSTATDPSTKVIAAEFSASTPLYLEPLYTGPGTKLNQLWTFRQGDLTGTGNGRYYIIANANSGKVMDVYGSYTAPGTRVQVYYRKNTPNQLFYFHS